MAEVPTLAPRHKARPAVVLVEEALEIVVVVADGTDVVVDAREVVVVDGLELFEQADAAKATTKSTRGTSQRFAMTAKLVLRS